MKKKYIFIVMILMLFSIGCTQNDTSPNIKFNNQVDDQFRKLSTNENSEAVPYSEYENDHAQTENEEEHTENEDQFLEGRHGIEDPISEPENEEPLTNNTSLSFNDFRERWNALSDELMSELYITQIEQSDHDLHEYVAHFNRDMRLRITIANNYVQQIDVIAKPKSKEQVLKMLTAWQQTIQMMYPDLEIHDVDRIFSEIGVGPDGDLSKVNNTSFTDHNLQYELIEIDQQYTLRISYTS